MSDLGSLSECLVDNDPAARVRARRLRSKALMLSVALEAAILLAMLVWPLIAPSVLTAHYIVTLAPPYSGVAPHTTSSPRRIAHTRRLSRSASPFARRRFIRRPQQMVRRRRTSMRAAIRLPMDQARRVLGRASPRAIGL
jgi:hypothetical protein